MVDTPPPNWSTAATQEQLAFQKKQNELLTEQVELLKAGQAGAKNNATTLSEKMAGLGREMGTAGTGGGFGKFGKFAGIVDLATSALSSLTTRAVDAADSIFTMYSSGVVMQMDQLSASVDAFGMSLPDVTKLMTKHGQTISMMGINRTNAMGDAFRRATANGTELGMSLEQSNEVLMTFADIMNKTGSMRLMNETQLADGARDFALKLNEAAQATGKNVDQIKQEIADRMKMPDMSFLMLHMTEEQKAQARMTELTMSKFGESGALLADKMKLLQTTGGSYSGVAKDDPILVALNATQKELLRQATFEQDPVKQEALIRQLSASIEANPLALSQAIAGSQNKEATNIQGMIVRDVNAAKETDTTSGIEGGGGAPPDETAKLIKDAQAQFTSALNSADIGLTNMAVAAAESVIPAMTTLTDDANELASEFSKFTATLLGNPINPETLQTLGQVGIASAAALITLNAFNSAGGAAGGGIAAVKAEEAAIAANKAQAKATAVAIGGWLTEQAGSVASAMGYTKTGAGLQAGGEIAMDAAIGRIIGKFLKMPFLGTIIGGGYGAYNQSDNIRTATGLGPTTAESATVTTGEGNTPTSADVITATPEQQMEIQTTALVTPLEQIATDSSSNVTQNKLMLDTMTEVLTQLRTLNTNINDQTTSLRNAFSRGSGNVYP